MAYVSASYSKNWTYELGGTSFDAKLGALLTNGAILQVSEATVCGKLEQDRHSSCQHRLRGSGNVNDNPYKKETQGTPWVGPRPGFAWVDEQGQPLAVGPPATLLAAANAGDPDVNTTPLTGSSSGSNHQSKQHSTTAGGSYVGMTASQRSMAMWQRISPGMLPGTTKTPPATTAEAYAYDAAVLEPVDFTHHLKRTDFAEYTECALRHMHHLKAAAKK